MFPYQAELDFMFDIQNDILQMIFYQDIKNANGFNVLHPMWWDAFWLPAEKHAIKTWTHPKITTQKNIDTFRSQIKALWFSYDWDREVDTTDPKYYKWTQWIFLKLFEHGLAYEQDLPINYCPSCKTGLYKWRSIKWFYLWEMWDKVEKKNLNHLVTLTSYKILPADTLTEVMLILEVIVKVQPEGIKVWKSWIGRNSERVRFEIWKNLMIIPNQ